MSKKKNLKKFSVQCDLYDFVLDVWVWGDEYALREELRKMGEDHAPDGRNGGYFIIKNPTNYNRVSRRIIWIEEFKEDLLIHELLHAVCEIMMYKNIPLTEDETEEVYHVATEEAWCYMLEFLYREAKKQIVASRRKK